MLLLFSTVRVLYQLVLVLYQYCEGTLKRSNISINIQLGQYQGEALKLLVLTELLSKLKTDKYNKKTMNVLLYLVPGTPDYKSTSTGNRIATVLKESILLFEACQKRQKIRFMFVQTKSYSYRCLLQIKQDVIYFSYQIIKKSSFENECNLYFSFKFIFSIQLTGLV